jgi:hypothetical protein
MQCGIACLVVYERPMKEKIKLIFRRRLAAAGAAIVL